MTQRTDARVISDADKQRATTAERRYLRANGIRNVHTNRKAQAAIARAATAKLQRELGGRG